MSPSSNRAGSPSLGAKHYRRLLVDARRDPNVLGVVLTGSRGARRAEPASDYDVLVVVRDAAALSYRRRFARPPPGLDIAVLGASAFRRADRGPQTEGHGPAFAHILVPIDKTGRVARTARAKARVPRAKIRSYTATQLDAYLNELLRSLKCFRAGDLLAGHLEATRSLTYLLETLFGSEGRWAPYAKYLEWELRHFPLRRPPLPTPQLLRLLGRILEDGDASDQRAVFRAVERNLRPRGFGRVFDSWGPARLAFFRTGGVDAPVARRAATSGARVRRRQARDLPARNRSRGATPGREWPHGDKCWRRP